MSLWFWVLKVGKEHHPKFSKLQPKKLGYGKPQLHGILGSDISVYFLSLLQGSSICL